VSDREIITNVRQLSAQQKNYDIEPNDVKSQWLNELNHEQIALSLSILYQP